MKFTHELTHTLMALLFFGKIHEFVVKDRSLAFISLVYLAVMALIMATPKGGVLKAIKRVSWDYPADILTDPSGWFYDIIRYF